MNCDVCGCNLKDERGYNVAALKISLLGANPARKKVESLFGKNQFRICYVCRLKSLGIKEIKHEDGIS